MSSWSAGNLEEFDFLCEHVLFTSNETLLNAIEQNDWLSRLVPILQLVDSGAPAAVVESAYRENNRAQIGGPSPTSEVEVAVMASEPRDGECATGGRRRGGKPLAAAAEDLDVAAILAALAKDRGSAGVDDHLLQISHQHGSKSNCTSLSLPSSLAGSPTSPGAVVAAAAASVWNVTDIA